MGFRQRLVFFLVVTLVAVQALTVLFVYGFARHSLVEQGKRELAAAAGTFMRQLNVLSEHVSDDVEVLSLDYALRLAIAQRDRDTVFSALRNHGHRIGATRMLLIGLDGEVAADTQQPDAPAAAFSFPDLLSGVTATGQGTSLVAFDGGVYWIVVVPVRAPVPIAFIAAYIPVNDALLEKLRELSSPPRAIALATTKPDGMWSIVTKSAGYSPEVHLSSSELASTREAAITTQHGEEHLTMMARLQTAPHSAPVIAILDYPLEQSLNAYRAVITPLLLVLGGALAVALAGAMLIARGVSRPLEMLAATARRIAAGDYTPPSKLDQRDEIGQLSVALTNMTQSIAERETALVSAVNARELARNEAVKASEAKSQFLANISHELRTPLNAIIGFSEMIYGQILGPVGISRYVEYAQHVRDSGKHLLVQVEEMLDLADADTGRLTLSRQVIDPDALVDASVKTLSPFAEKARVRVDRERPPATPPALEGDVSKLQQAFTNLIHNAIKFTPAGGRVTVCAKLVDGVFRTKITDTGIGMRAEDITLVVRPFHRRRAAFDAKYQGAGLGLPFAKAIIEHHGGTVGIESAPGAGTIVTVDLPLVAANTSRKIDSAA